MGEKLNGKQRKTLAAICEVPTRSDIAWRDIENLLEALGATIKEGRGSRVRVALNGCVAVFHEPHPERVASRGCVKAVRNFLEDAGFSP